MDLQTRKRSLEAPWWRSLASQAACPLVISARLLAALLVDIEMYSFTNFVERWKAYRSNVSQSTKRIL